MLPTNKMGSVPTFPIYKEATEEKVLPEKYHRFLFTAFETAHGSDKRKATICLQKGNSKRDCEAGGEIQRNVEETKEGGSPKSSIDP